jgi:predicted small lipoprotein YifL
MRRALTALVVLAVGLVLAGCGSSTPTPVAAPSTVTVTTTAVSTTRATTTRTVTETITTTVDPAATGTTGPAVSLPDGFDAYGTGFGGRFADEVTDDENTECGDDACWAVEAWNGADCPSGVQVKVIIYDGPADDTDAPVLQTVNQAVRPADGVAAGSITRLLVKASRDNATSDQLSADLTDVTCG